MDKVLIVEALTPEFANQFWKFIHAGKYRSKATNGEKPQFYRFDKPEEDSFPINGRVVLKRRFYFTRNGGDNTNTLIDEIYRTWI